MEKFQYLREILILLGEERRKLPKLFVFFFGVSVLDLAGLGLIGPYVALVINAQNLNDSFKDFVLFVGLPTEERELLLLLSLLLFCVFLGKAITAIGIHGLIIHFSEHQQARLRSFLMQSYQNLPYGDYLRRNSSEYIYSIQNLTQQFSEGVVFVGMRTLSDSIIAIVILGILAWTDGLALCLLIGLLGTMVLGYDLCLRRRISGYGTKANQAATQVVKGIYEGIEGLKEIRILGRESYFHRTVHDEANKYANYRARYQLISVIPRYTLEWLMVTFVVLLVTVFLISHRPLSSLIPTLSVFGLAALRLLPMVNTLAYSLASLRYHRDAVSRLHRDISQLQEARLAQLQVQPQSPAPFKNLKLHEIRFRYPRAIQDALIHLSLEIRAGESIGLIGASGAGKTTLVDVLLGLLEPQDGKIRYNGKLLDQRLNEWRSQVAYLPQQVFLVDATLRHNVALGVDDAKIDTSLLNKALQQARLQELVSQLPSGVDTLLGEHGMRLSGGQRQRVALARAFYHKRAVLVMDEATSALDSETEHEIISEIQELKGEKTMIVIAHRLTTVEHCDRIYRLEKGRIIEEGSPEQILRASSASNT